MISARARLVLWAMVTIAASTTSACEDEKKPASGAPPAPAGSGYDDLRVLSRDDCTMLRDHQIDIAVEQALAPDGGTSTLDPGERLSLEAQLRLKSKGDTDAWIARCVGRMVPASDLRCMREATTPQAFNACGALNDRDDAGGSDASDGNHANDARDATSGGG